MPDQAITIKAPARAHLGFIDPSGQLPRKFGSFGITLAHPSTTITIKKSSKLTLTGPESERAERYIRSLSSYFSATTNFEINIKEAIPAHAGLGSGTQLALALGVAYAQALGHTVSAEEIATVLNRGKRSGIGIAAFATGGALLDAGRKSKSGLPPIIARQQFPEAWRILLIYDRSKTAIHGQDEIDAFEHLPPFKEQDAASICYKMVTGLVAAIAEQDFDVFSSTIFDIQIEMGQFYAPIQGGHFSSSNVSEVAQWLKTQGIKGVGQSSWGPTGVAFFKSDQQARNILALAKQHWPEKSGLQFELTKGRNHGAEIYIGNTQIEKI